MKPNQLKQQAKNTLQSCLKEVPFLKTDWSPKQPRNIATLKPDLMVKLKWRGGQRVLLAVIRESGQPRQAREAIDQILEYQETIPEAYGVFVAPYISPKATQVCTDAGMGYLDLVGNCRLTFGQVFVVKEGKPNTKNRSRDVRSLYSPKGERMLRVLLNDPSRRWKIQEIAAESKISLGQASNIKRLLNDREWIKVEPEGFYLKEPQPLLNEWLTRYDYRRSTTRNYYSMDSITEIENKLAECCSEHDAGYALTKFSAAARRAPMVRYQRVTAYVTGNMGKVVRTMKLKEVGSGSNVSLVTPYDDGVYIGSEEIEGVSVVSAIQACLDLQDARGRGDEAAEALLKEITAQW